MQITINGAPIFFDVVGSTMALAGPTLVERPTLIVLHGGPGFDHAVMRPYFDRFADTHQVIYVDHRGNGRSGGDPETWNLAQWGDDIDAFCQALGIRQPIVFGNSFGGMVAMSYGVRHPEGPGKLVLSSTAARLDLQATYVMMERLGGAAAREAAETFWTRPSQDTGEAYMATCLPLYNPAPPKDGSDRARTTMRTEVMFHFILGEQGAMNFLPELGGISCPTLVLAGGIDPITPVACFQAIFEALPPALRRLEVFEGAGHGVYRDEPERAERVLRAFFAG